MRLVIVEDEPHWQETISRIVAAGGAHEIVALCSNVRDALSLSASASFDLMIVDLGLPDGSGVDVIRAVRRNHADADILVATVFDDESNVVKAICAGATGYLLKESTPQEWASAIDDLREGRSPINPKIARFILRALQQRDHESARAAAAAPSATPRPQDEALGLSTREIEVLKLVAKGFTLVEVARILGVTHNTARSHAKNIYRKLEVSSRGEAVFEAAQRGLL